MRILGIDPGTNTTGWAVIESDTMEVIDFGCICPPKGATAAQKYRIIFDAIETLINRYQPRALSVEGQFMHKNALSALKLGMARGMALLAAEKASLEIAEYAPKKVKKAVVGNGSASKEQVQWMIQKLLGLRELPTPHDAADALALAICHAHHLKFNYV